MGISEFFADCVEEAKRWLVSDSTAHADFKPQVLIDPLEAPNAPRFSDLLSHIGWEEESELFILGDMSGKVKAMGFVLELYPQTGSSEAMANILTQIISLFPAGTGLQFSNLLSPHIGGNLAQYYNSRAAQPAETSLQRERRDYFLYCAKRRVEYYEQLAKENLIPGEPFLLRDSRVWLAVCVPADRHDNKDLNESIGIMRDSSISILRSYYQFSHVWGPDEMLNTLSSLVNSDSEMVGCDAPSLVYDGSKEIRHQAVSAESLTLVTSNSVRLGLPGAAEQMAVVPMSVRSYPREFTLNMMTELLGASDLASVGYPCPLLITENVVVPDFEKSKGVTQLKYARAQQKAESPMAKIDPQLIDIRDDWRIAQEAHDAGGGVVEMTHQILLFCNTGDIAKCTEAAKAVWRKQNFELMVDSFVALQGYLSALPCALTPDMISDLRRLKRLGKRTAVNAINLAPILGEWSGVVGARRVMPLIAPRGRLGFFDQFADRNYNHNVIVVGTSGAGKSATLNDLIAAQIALGARIWVIDKGRSYEKTCIALKGQFITFDRGSNVCIPPFALVNLENPDWEEDVLTLLVPLFEAMITPEAPLDQAMRAILMQHIRSVILDHPNGDAKIDDLVYSLINNCESGGPNPLDRDPEWIATVRNMSREERSKHCDPAVRKLGVALYPYMSDQVYGKYFNGPLTVNFNDDLVILELDGLGDDPQLQSVMMFLITYRILTDMFRDRQRPKICLIDEAWTLLGNDAGAQFLDAGYRTARKYFGGFIAATQQFSDFDGSACARVARDNSNYMIALAQDPKAMAKMEAGASHLTPDQIKQLKALRKNRKYAEMLVDAGKMGAGVMRAMFDPFSMVVNASDPLEFEEIKRRLAAGESIMDAILAVERQKGTYVDTSTSVKARSLARI